MKILKKGDLSVCSNWRGINLLLVLGKIFCRILLLRMRQAIERILREQAGFRSGRECIDQSFVLRTIVEQCRLKISIGKTKMMKLKNKSNAKSTVQGTDLEEIQHFKHLGSYISADSNIEKGGFYEDRTGCAGFQQATEQVEGFNPVNKHQTQDLQVQYSVRLPIRIRNLENQQEYRE